jgi:hypothetical protein
VAECAEVDTPNYIHILKIVIRFLRLVQDPISMHLAWKQSPENIFVLKKNEDSVFEAFNELVSYLVTVIYFRLGYLFGSLSRQLKAALCFFFF